MSFKTVEELVNEAIDSSADDVRNEIGLNDPDAQVEASQDGLPDVVKIIWVRADGESADMGLSADGVDVEDEQLTATCPKGFIKVGSVCRRIVNRPDGSLCVVLDDDSELDVVAVGNDFALRKDVEQPVNG